jgi:hypothetical protein
MNPFVEEAVAVVEVVEAVVVAEEAVVVAVEAVVVMEEVAVEVVMAEVVTVTEDADMVEDMVADIMEEVMEEDGEVGAGGPSMAGLIAEANPVLIIFSKSLNDHPFSQ